MTKHRRILTIAVTCLLTLSGWVCDTVVIAQDEPALTESEPASAADPAEKSDDPKEEQRQAAVAGLLVLSLVCLVFLFLILFVVMWARRMRRLVNQPLPDQHPGDPLWYLRKPSAAPAAEED